MSEISGMHYERSGSETVFTRRFKAPREALFKAWTDPEQMTKWWGPNGFDSTCDVDVRKGGAYRIVMRSPDGTEYPITGRFLEVEAPQRLVMSANCSEHPDHWHALLNSNYPERSGKYTDDILWTIDFEQEDEYTKLTIRTTFKTVADLEAFVKMGMLDGWTEMLQRLEAALGA